MLNQKIRKALARFRMELSPELSALIEQGAGEISRASVPNNYRRRAEVAQILEALQQISVAA